MTALLLAAVLTAAPNIVFITSDTLQADHLGCYGYDHPTSPNIDRLASDGIVFDNCICEVPLTAPSLSAMMTGRLPRSTGVTRNGLRLPGDIPTLAEQFRAAGYATWCVQSNWTLKASLSGLDRGFDVYDDAFHTKRWGVIKSERYADEVTRVALELLSKRDPGRPFFAWIHYSDPHAPYRAHRQFLMHDKPYWRLDKAGQVRAKYDSEIAYMDSCVARLLEALPHENTFVVFSADHGESLYEHGYLGHGRRIYQTGLHIPLIITGPGIQPARSPVPARGLDVGPTLLGLAGLPPFPETIGIDLTHTTVAPTRPRIIETYGGAVPRWPGARALMADRPPQRQGILLNEWKLILHGDAMELFDLRGDPWELKNLAAIKPEMAHQYSRLIADWNSHAVRRKESPVPLSRDDLDALQSLGYLK